MTVTDANEGWFSGEVVPPNEATAAFASGPPRDGTPYLARWVGGTLGPGTRAPTRPAERIESASLTYELLGLPRELRSGRREVGVEAAVMPVNVLYPAAAPLQEQGGAPTLAEVPLALWDDDTTRSDRGQYYTYSAEAPIEFAGALLVKNRQLVIDGVTFRIVDPYVAILVPRVLMTLRGPRQ